MITRLRIKNYALIDELEIDFSKGLTIITGETGAGKSILLGALGLIMGKRADTKVLAADHKCVVEAYFEVGKYNLEVFFKEYDLDYHNEVVVRREITPSGKSRGFINDTPATLPILQQLSAELIDLHQQFDTLDLHQQNFQLKMIDALAGNRELLKNYGDLFQEYQQEKQTLAKLRQQNQAAAREEELLAFLLEEFNKAELRNGEQEELEEELSRLNNAEEIKKNSGTVFQQLSESEQSVISQLQELSLSINNLTAFHSELAVAHKRFEGLIYELQDLSQEFERIAEKTEYDPARIQEAQERLDLIYRLQNKHQVSSITDLLGIQEETQQKLDAIGDLSSEINRLEQSILEKEKQLTQLALELREKRKSVIPNFQERVLKLLGQLAMEYSRLDIEMTETPELTPTGRDEINFLFAANRGSRLQLIKDVASGGELARLNLVTKSLVASSIPLPTLLFDEIDTGISGEIALKMGDILRRLSDRHQVVSITHSPQVASKADAHYFVYKIVTEDRTITKVKSLTAEERIRAVAVMLSSNPPSQSALENARELINAKVS